MLRDTKYGIWSEVRQQKDQFTHSTIISILHMWRILNSTGSSKMWLSRVCGRMVIKWSFRRPSPQTWITFQTRCTILLEPSHGGCFWQSLTMRMRVFDFFQKHHPGSFLLKPSEVERRVFMSRAVPHFWSIIRKTCNLPDSCNLSSYKGFASMKHVHQKYVENNCWCLLLVFVIVRHGVCVSDSGSNHQPPPQKQINCSVVRIDWLIDTHWMWCGASHLHYLLGISLSLHACVCVWVRFRRASEATDWLTSKQMLLHIVEAPLWSLTAHCVIKPRCVCVSVSACLRTTLSQFFSLFPKSILATVFHVLISPWATSSRSPPGGLCSALVNLSCTL